MKLVRLCAASITVSRRKNGIRRKPDAYSFVRDGIRLCPVSLSSRRRVFVRIRFRSNREKNCPRKEGSSLSSLHPRKENLEACRCRRLLRRETYMKLLILEYVAEPVYCRASLDETLKTFILAKGTRRYDKLSRHPVHTWPVATKCKESRILLRFRACSATTLGFDLFFRFYPSIFLSSFHSRFRYATNERKSEISIFFDTETTEN